jgi:hypothetical protein
MSDTGGLTGGTGDDGLDLDVAAVSILNANRDVRLLLKTLVAQLSTTLGDRVKVERKGGFLRKSDEIQSVEASVGKDQFLAELHGDGAICSIGHASGGIRIRSEEVTMDEWLRRLLAALQAESAHSEAARAALEHIVIGGP